MTDHDMDPELRTFEHRLKTLKPKRVTLDATNLAMPLKAVSPKRDDLRLRLRLAGILATTVATAISLIVIVGFHDLRSSNDRHGNTTVTLIADPPELQPHIMPPTMLPTSKSGRHAGFESPTIRRQLAMLLDEMTIRETIPEKKPDYPVIEITVSTEPQKPSPFREHPKILRAGSTGILPETG